MLGRDEQESSRWTRACLLWRGRSFGIRSDTRYCLAFATLVEKRERGTAECFLQTDPLKKPLAGGITLRLTIFFR